VQFGQAYKKCRGDPTRQDVGAVRPLSPDMINVVQRMQQMHAELKPLRLTSRPPIHLDFQDQKLRAVRNRIYYGPANETLHEFLVKHLFTRMGRHWFETEAKKHAEERHVILQWDKQLHDEIGQAAELGECSSGRIGLAPSDDVQALTVLADDVFQLEGALKTPRKILERLRDQRHFQGARHEILAASIFARCGFEIEFIDDKTKKMPEFFATKAALRERIAVEAKSRHRPGVLHHPGNAAAQSSELPLRADVERLLHDALEQNPGGLPFFAFIDLNLPLTPGVPTEQKPWFKDLQGMFARIEAGTEGQQDNFTGVVFTNYGWHYSRGKGAPGGEYVIVTSFNPRYPVSPETWQLLRRALDEYGFIPDEEQHEKEVRAKYPEFK
jgi:hypothetical protein